MGRIDFLTKTEIKRLKDDEEAVRVGLQANQISIANALKNGVGEEIIKDLTDAKKKEEKKDNKFRTWLKKWRKIWNINKLMSIY